MEWPQAVGGESFERFAFELRPVQRVLVVVVLCGLATLLVQLTQPGAIRASDPDSTGTLTTAIGVTRIRPTDGMPTVYVPEGEFVMGSSRGDAELGFKACKAVQDNCQRDWFAVEMPQHLIYLDAFWIDQYEVSNAQYRQCVEAGECSQPACWDQASFAGSDQPVVCVDWHQAMAYCAWVGARLPTEAEWEKAARGTEAATYPWGDEFDGTRLNYCDRNCLDEKREQDVDDGYQYTAPVNGYPEGASPYGALNTAGNVWEWVSDWYDPNYYAISPYRNPTGPATGLYKVQRGGSYGNYRHWLRSAIRRGWFRPEDINDYVGFRCASSATVSFHELNHEPNALEAQTAASTSPIRTPHSARTTRPPQTPYPSRTPSPTATSCLRCTVPPTAETPSSVEPAAGATSTRPADGMVMVYVPAGEFYMGSPPGVGEDDEHPRHKVDLDGYWIDQTEVTNQQFEGFVQATGYRTDAEQLGEARVYLAGQWQGISGADWRHPEGPASNLSGRSMYPVVNVSWYDAHAYCTWAGARLPSEAEWEKAARGTDERMYPWGNEKASCTYAVINAGTKDGCGQGSRPWPVGSKPRGASPYGALDMAGNVWEWVNDWYAETYYAESPLSNPSGPATGQAKVARGGSWHFAADMLRAVDRVREAPDKRNTNLGFRCAMSRLGQTPTSTAVASSTVQLRPIDKMQMVYVPAGEFLMGSLPDTGNSSERPQHVVYLDSYWIDRTEVTNAQYRLCVNAGICSAPGCWKEKDFSDDDQPVVCVDWVQAHTYCQWAGVRLPTEAEWEKAARGLDGRTYPWGEQPPSCLYAVMNEGGKGCGAEKPWPVGSKLKGASPYGALDMAGNVWEWVADWYAADYYQDSPVRNPAGPSSGLDKVLRGGSWSGEAD